MSTNVVQDYLAFDQRAEGVQKPDAIALPPMPLSAQIDLENAARQRFSARTGRALTLIAGGAVEASTLTTLCEHCGERPGQPHRVAYTQRPVQICPTCRALDRQVTTATNQIFAAAVRLSPVVMLPSDSLPAVQIERVSA